MNVKVFLILLALFIFASPIFAQTPADAAHESHLQWVVITSGFSMAIASAGCGLAQAKATAAAAEGMGRFHSVCTDYWLGADRIAGALHAGHYFRQGQLVLS